MDLLANITIHTGDAIALLKKLPAGSVDCVVTSPPYWGLRDYKAEGQYGQEPSPAAYIKRMVQVFRQVRRVLANDGTLWLNIGDSYAGNGGQYGNAKSTLQGARHNTSAGAVRKVKRGHGLKPKDLVGIPWMLAFALRADGWYLRQDIIWRKPNAMPSSVTDRCTAQHEYLFLLSKSAVYHFDSAAIQEPAAGDTSAPRNRWDRSTEEVPGQKPQKRTTRSGNTARVYGVNSRHPHVDSNVPWEGNTRNKRSVWDVPTACYPEEHYAVFPPKLIEPCVLAGCRGGGYGAGPFRWQRHHRWRSRGPWPQGHPPRAEPQQRGPHAIAHRAGRARTAQSTRAHSGAWFTQPLHR